MSGTLRAMRWFGHPYDAPAWDQMDQVGIPVGQPCADCTIPITTDDDGISIPDAVSGRYLPEHLACFIAAILGPDAPLPRRRLHAVPDEPDSPDEEASDR